MFDHTKGATKAYDGDIPHLEQKDENGIKQIYTNANYDNILKKWVPEPQLITEEETYKGLEVKVETEIKKAIPLLEKLMPIAKAVEEFSRKATMMRTDKDERFHKVTGEANYYKAKCKEYEVEAESLELKRKMNDLENTKRKAGRPKKEARIVEQIEE